jgi:putative phosphoribosyl transferase
VERGSSVATYHHSASDCGRSASVESVEKIYRDRRDAGRKLAKLLECMPGWNDAKDVIVLGLPRGGVPVAYEIALRLSLPLDVLVVRKLGVPGQEELAMGAIASGGIMAMNPSVVERAGISQEAIEAVVQREKLEIERREYAYRGGRPLLPIQGRGVILVDDGMATGASMSAAVRALRVQAARILVAVPAAPLSTCEELRREVDEVICAATPKEFIAVGDFYGNFNQTMDEEVRSLLAERYRAEEARVTPARVASK